MPIFYLPNVALLNEVAPRGGYTFSESFLTAVRMTSIDKPIHPHTGGVPGVGIAGKTSWPARLDHPGIMAA